jgi:hypothetical protein
MSHRAVRIVFRDIDEFFFRLFVPEGVKEGDAASEWFLHRVGA